MNEADYKCHPPTLPLFITFTGVDSRTNIENMRWISDRYPVEWGVLFSRKRQGRENRYPNMNGIDFMMVDNNRVDPAPMRFAAHLCGDLAREIMEYETGDMRRYPVKRFDRIQINHGEPSVAAAQRFGQMAGKRCILQCRDTESFPREHDVDWLYDVSGGNGVRPKKWLPHPGRLVGYAGGINPGNVLDTIQSINGLMGRCGPYWIDMESSVRTDDWFDLVKVRTVCEVVYGERP